MYGNFFFVTKNWGNFFFVTKNWINLKRNSKIARGESEACQTQATAVPRETEDSRVVWEVTFNPIQLWESSWPLVFSSFLIQTCVYLNIHSFNQIILHTLEFTGYFPEAFKFHCPKRKLNEN